MARYHDLAAVRIPDEVPVPEVIGSYALGKRLDKRA
jgi:hypothetical protein